MADSGRAATAVLPLGDQLAEARLVYLRPDGREAGASLGETPVEIGSDPRADLALDDAHVSRRHARVGRDRDGILVEDLGSRNGTYVNGVRVERALLNRDAVITCGTCHLRLALGPERSGATDFGTAFGRSPRMRNLFEILERLACRDVSILLLGETGTGKDVIARAIHARSLRANEPFAVFDCAAVAPNLVESDLFGHDRGAFTGAVQDREGVFERGSSGTVFLDEIGELPLDLQPRLLRVLEERTVRRVGGTDPVFVDVRMIAATHRDLELEAESGRFRQDLFYRLSTAVVEIPPLRQRLEDLPTLVERFLGELGGPHRVADETLSLLRGHRWPGNVRELRNVIERAAALADGPVLLPEHVSLRQSRGGDSTLDRLPLGGRRLERLERAAIAQTLNQTNGNKSRAARALGIAASTLYDKIRKYGL